MQLIMNPLWAAPRPSGPGGWGSARWSIR